MGGALTSCSVVALGKNEIPPQSGGKNGENMGDDIMVRPTNAERLADKVGSGQKQGTEVKR